MITIKDNQSIIYTSIVAIVAIVAIVFLSNGGSLFGSFTIGEDTAGQAGRAIASNDQTGQQIYVAEGTTGSLESPQVDVAVEALHGDYVIELTLERPKSDGKLLQLDHKHLNLVRVVFEDEHGKKIILKGDDRRSFYDRLFKERKVPFYDQEMRKLGYIDLERLAPVLVENTGKIIYLVIRKATPADAALYNQADAAERTVEEPARRERSQQYEEIEENNEIRETLQYINWQLSPTGSSFTGEDGRSSQKVTVPADQISRFTIQDLVLDIQPVAPIPADPSSLAVEVAPSDRGFLIAGIAPVVNRQLSSEAWEIEALTGSKESTTFTATIIEGDPSEVEYQLRILQGDE